MAQSNTNENSAAGYLSQVLSGKKPANPELVAIWTKALRLNADEASVLRFLATLTYIPDEWNEEFIDIFDRDRASRGLPSTGLKALLITPFPRQREAHRKGRKT